MLLSMLTGACHPGEPTGLRTPDPLALTERSRFLAMADSAAAAGAPPVVVSAYVGVARALGDHERVTPVRLTLDGAEDDWLAFGREVGMHESPCPPNAFCVRPLAPLTSVVAWRRNDPRQIVQFTGDGGSAAIGVLPIQSDGTFASGATLTLLDARGGVFTAVSGTQSIAVTHTDWACATGAGAVTAQAFGAGVAPPYTVAAGPDPFVCTVAGMNASVTGVVQPSAVLSPPGGAPSGSHVLTMAPQDVGGAHLEMQSCAACYIRAGYPSSMLPPLSIRGITVLQTSLQVTVDTVVTLSLDVLNPTAAPVVLEFSDAQQYDFTVTPAGSRVPAWRWSAGRGFSQMLTSRTLAPGEHWVVAESWHPNFTGLFTAVGVVKSTSHYTEASGYGVVP